MSNGGLRSRKLHESNSSDVMATGETSAEDAGKPGLILCTGPIQ